MKDNTIKTRLDNQLEKILKEKDIANAIEVNTMPTFGERLKKLRKDAGYTSMDGLAKRIGVSLRCYGEWERDKAMPRESHIKALSKVLNVSSDYLKGLTLNPQNNITNDSFDSLVKQFINELKEDADTLNEIQLRIIMEASDNEEIHLSEENKSNGFTENELNQIILQNKTLQLRVNQKLHRIATDKVQKQIEQNNKELELKLKESQFKHHMIQELLTKHGFEIFRVPSETGVIEKIICDGKIYTVLKNDKSKTYLRSISDGKIFEVPEDTIQTLIDSIMKSADILVNNYCNTVIRTAQPQNL